MSRTAGSQEKKGGEVSAFSARICGRVQGVGFRYYCRDEAQRRGLSGWVRNTEDGAVEVYSEGPQEAQAQFLKWLHQGPRGARVDSVRSCSQTPTGAYCCFSITC
jgi:acylphosphatase